MIDDPLPPGPPHWDIPISDEFQSHTNEDIVWRSLSPLSLQGGGGSRVGRRAGRLGQGRA
jgi:hypothetical protein